MVAAWNDGKGYDDGTGQTQATPRRPTAGSRVDRGTFSLPTAYAATWQWTSDPVVTVNPTTGAFYFAALADASSSLYAIGVVKGRFTGSTFAWGTPSVPRTASTSAWRSWTRSGSRSTYPCPGPDPVLYKIP